MLASFRRARGFVALASAALVLSACWPVPGGTGNRNAHLPFASAITPDSVADLEPAWAAALGPGASGPVLTAGGVYVRVGQQVSRLDPTSGTVDWTWSLPPDVAAVAGVGEPMVIGGRVYVGYGFGNFGGGWFGQALDPATGDTTGDPAATGLLQAARGTRAAGTTVFFGSGTPVLEQYVVTDVATGDVVGAGRVAIHNFGGGTGTGRMTVGETGVYHAGFGVLSATPGQAQGGGVRSIPDGAPVGCGPSSANLVCPAWATPLATTTHVVVDPDQATLYVGVAGGSVTALDAATGAVLWTAPVGADVGAAPALAGDVLYVPTVDGDLVAVDDATGAVVWSAAIDGTALRVQPAVTGTGADAVVFAGTEGGTVAAVAADGCGTATCGTLWDATVGDRITGAPAFGHDQVYVGTAGGEVTAFGLPAA